MKPQRTETKQSLHGTNDFGQYLDDHPGLSEKLHIYSGDETEDKLRSDGEAYKKEARNTPHISHKSKIRANNCFDAIRLLDENAPEPDENPLYNPAYSDKQIKAFEDLGVHDEHGLYNKKVDHNPLSRKEFIELVHQRAPHDKNLQHLIKHTSHAPTQDDYLRNPDVQSEVTDLQEGLAMNSNPVTDHYPKVPSNPDTLITYGSLLDNGQNPGVAEAMGLTTGERMKGRTNLNLYEEQAYDAKTLKPVNEPEFKKRLHKAVHKVRRNVVTVAQRRIAYDPEGYKDAYRGSTNPFDSNYKGLKIQDEIHADDPHYSISDKMRGLDNHDKRKINKQDFHDIKQYADGLQHNNDKLFASRFLNSHPNLKTRLGVETDRKGEVRRRDVGHPYTHDKLIKRVKSQTKALAKAVTPNSARQQNQSDDKQIKLFKQKTHALDYSMHTRRNQHGRDISGQRRHVSHKRSVSMRRRNHQNQAHAKRNQGHNISKE